MALEESRKALNGLLDVPEDTRGEDWSAKLDAGRKAVEVRQAELLAVGAVEPDPVETRTATTSEEKDLAG